MLICLDPGHGGKDSGAIGPTGLKEKDVVLSLALKLGTLLKKQNMDIIYTRTTDTFIPLSKRAQIANMSHADYFISLHVNSANQPTAKGTEVFICTHETITQQFASCIQNALIATHGLSNRGVKVSSFTVLQETYMPAILIELAFISNTTEESLLQKDSFLLESAEAISCGFLKFLDIFDSLSKTPTSSHWSQSALNDLAALKLISLPKDPKGFVTWGEFSTVIFRLIKHLQ